MELCKFNWVTDHLPKEKGSYICIVSDEYGENRRVMECRFCNEGYDGEPMFEDMDREMPEPQYVLAWASSEVNQEFNSSLFVPYPHEYCFTKLKDVLGYHGCHGFVEILDGYKLSLSIKDLDDKDKPSINYFGHACYDVYTTYTLSFENSSGEVIDSIFMSTKETDDYYEKICLWIEDVLLRIMPDVYKKGMIHRSNWNYNVFMGDSYGNL